ncbi:hypothetical protein IG197_26755 [Aminobacter sp. SR38]|jgi:hypothetical protein|uniref:hypothetical protein n=1 Tax=Aminobacter sp. SR38 TaxID=2774562 RepID=UPI00177BFF21|nr:hypothetical protein [Aminobacter sp. SR38]QOF71313.1 hypothetical protein IG197_26755 [Aminobacter sp. SR38]
MPDLELVSMLPSPYAYVSRSGTSAQLGDMLAVSFEKLYGALSSSMVVPAGPRLVRYRKIDENEVLFDAGFPIREDQFRILRGSGLGLGATAAGEAVKAQQVGSREPLTDTYRAVLAEIHARGLTATGDMWEAYPGRSTSETVTELLWPLRDVPDFVFTPNVPSWSPPV